jgi:ferredoxin
VHVIDREGLDALFDRLRGGGYELVGPTVRDGTIAYAPLGSTADLPEGWTEEQDGGSYRLVRRGDRALFGYALGPHAWKAWLYPAERRLWSARRTEEGLEIHPEERPEPRLALIGVRGCELAAMRVQDRVLLEGAFADPAYRARRSEAFVVAVQCGEPGGTCFCASMGTGPGVEDGFDLALTELPEPGGSRFTVSAGSPRGEAVLERLPRREASPEDEAAAAAVVSGAARRMGRAVDADGLPELLASALEHPRWEAVAERCLTCGNCTMVCPTCFCSTIEDTTDLTGRTAERWRRWDSCFHTDFSYIHGGSVRPSPSSRYRQWLTHKLGTWFEQFGSSGCVGCGRCITWCPVGIDLTEEVAALRAAPPAPRGDDAVRRTPETGGDA